MSFLMLYTDAHATPASRQCHLDVLKVWNDFKQDHEMMEELTRINHFSAFFQKNTRDVLLDFTKMRPSRVLTSMD